MIAKRSPERQQFLASVLTTAIEGGISYWATVESYTWFDPDLAGGHATPGPGGTANARAVIFETEDDLLAENTDNEPAARHTVTVDTIATGMARFRTIYTNLPRHHYIRQALLADRTNGEDGDYDADIADIVLQLGVFGEVVYA